MANCKETEYLDQKKKKMKQAYLIEYNRIYLDDSLLRERLGWNGKDDPTVCTDYSSPIDPCYRTLVFIV